MLINFDLENLPLQIRTDSVVGSNESVTVLFHNAQGSNIAGGLTFFFLSNTLLYWLGWCSISHMNYPTALLSGADKIWMISLSRTLNVPRLVLHCNNKEVFNVVLSDTTCGSDGSWTTTWSRHVGKIEFAFDTASDYYRPGELIDFVVSLSMKYTNTV